PIASGLMSIRVWTITASVTGLPVALCMRRTDTTTSSPFLISAFTGSNTESFAPADTGPAKLMTTAMAAPAERNFRVIFQTPHGWTIGDATLVGPHSRTRTARGFGSRVAVHRQ